MNIIVRDKVDGELGYIDAYMKDNAGDIGAIIVFKKSIAFLLFDEFEVIQDIPEYSLKEH